MIPQVTVNGGGLVWSLQQQAIFKWFERSAARALVVRARAGTGKTTTIIEALNYAPEQNILVCAFNKSIADELNARITNGRAKAQTLHGVGLACVTRWYGRIAIDKSGERERNLTDRVCTGPVPEEVKQLVSKLHTKAREIKPHARKVGDITDLLWKFECSPDEMFWDNGYDELYVEQKALEAMELAATEKPTCIDFADMIFLPVRNRWMVKKYDLVVVDEAQDMTEAQLELARGVCRGRFVIVGDDRQAIYDFRGADSGSLDRLKGLLNADELGLTVTRRCGKNIVNLAKKLVPDFEAHDSNGDGEVLDIDRKKLNETIAHGDFLLSRTNAPLVAAAMSLLRNNKRARIKGRDIGKSLKTIVQKLGKNTSVNGFLMNLDGWEDSQVLKFEKTKAEARIALVRDQSETLRTLAEGVAEVPEIIERIDYLFTDDGLGTAGIVTCSSVHQAKGLESDRVFILANTLRNHSMEEKNIQYVAYTRARKQLTLVYGKDV